MLMNSIMNNNKTDFWRQVAVRVFVVVGLSVSVVTHGYAKDIGYTEGSRTALVIGNAQYTNSPLKNPGNDAHDMAEALRNIGFDVTLALDVDRRAMGKSIRAFGQKLKSRGGMGLFYYAGHGVQLDERNYMIPVDSPMLEEDEVPYDSVDVGSVLTKMESANNGLNVIILDACRNNPFPSRTRGSSRGLARVEAPNGSMIVYATKPGHVADDGTGRNGIFTGHLLNQLRTPGLTLRDTIQRTRDAVVEATNRKQWPTEQTTVIGRIQFTKPIEAPKVPELSPEPKPVLGPKPQALKTNPNKKPEQTLALKASELTRTLTVNVTPADARVRIMNIVAPYQPGIELDPKVAYDVYVTHRDYIAWRSDVTLERKDHRIDVVLAPKPEAKAMVKGNTEYQPLLTEQPSIPALSSIRGGGFSMGCSEGDRSCEKYEKPRVSLQVPSFQMSLTEVTVGQFKRFVKATGYVTDAERNAGGFNGCYVFKDIGGISRSTAGWSWNKDSNWKNPGFSQSDEHPVTCVSWNDALAYVNWLTSTTGVAHRLPTEAEWEFAARAGVTTRYQTGNSSNVLCNAGNGADKTVSPKGSRWSSRVSCSDAHWFSAPVASFAANAFGLHDMHGNVWEWVADTWTVNHEGKSGTAKAMLSGDRNQRVLRGGGWDGDARQQRLSARRLGQVASRTSMIGFRVVAEK